jgi:hypothetical protein
MTKSISPLRQRMIDDMAFRNMSPSTQKVYALVVRDRRSCMTLRLRSSWDLCSLTFAVVSVAGSEKQMEFTARLLGIAMVAGSLLVFAFLCPRGGRVNPILRADFTEQILLMILIAVVFSGALMALAGAPVGMPQTTVR